MIIEFITDDEEEEEGSTIICIIKFVDKKSEEELRHVVGNITINGVKWPSNNIITPSIPQS